MFGLFETTSQTVVKVFAQTSESIRVPERSIDNISTSFIPVCDFEIKSGLYFLQLCCNI